MAPATFPRNFLFPGPFPSRHGVVATVKSKNLQPRVGGPDGHHGKKGPDACVEAVGRFGGAYVFWRIRGRVAVSIVIDIISRGHRCAAPSEARAAGRRPRHSIGQSRGRIRRGLRAPDPRRGAGCQIACPWLGLRRNPVGFARRRREVLSWYGMTYSRVHDPRPLGFSPIPHTCA